MEVQSTGWSSTRHIGPMAGDLNSLLPGLGGDDSAVSINSIDSDGIALASIQGLYKIIQEKDTRITELEARVNALETSQSNNNNTSSQPKVTLNTWLPGLFGLLGVAAGVLMSQKEEKANETEMVFTNNSYHCRILPGCVHRLCSGESLSASLGYGFRWRDEPGRIFCIMWLNRTISYR